MKKMNYNYIIILVIISFLVLPFGRLCGEEAETDIKQLNEVDDLAVPADDVNHTMFYNKSWAVVIGINKYEKWPGLEYAVNDATSVKKRLEKLGFDEIISLMDREATKNNITRVLGDRLPRQVQKGDRVLIFFAGHGQTEDIGGRQYGYIIPVDGDIRDYYSSAISMAQVREFSKRIPAKHIYYVIDACYSGTQKCLSCPPGLAPVTFNETAVKKIEARKTQVNSWYLDLSMIRQYWGSERLYHHTAPINMNYALLEALKIVKEEGLENRWTRHLRNHKILHAGLEAIGIKYVAQAGYELPMLNAVAVPDGVDDATARNQLLSEFGIEIGGGLGEFKGKAWRIGLMGAASTESNVMLFLSALEKCLTAQGYKFDTGASIAAAVAESLK